MSSFLGIGCGDSLRYTETARDPGQTPQQLFARLKATTQKGANRMLRIEGILRVIAQDSHSPGRVQSAEDSVAKLRAQLVELQQSEAALEGQVWTTHTPFCCSSFCGLHLLLSQGQQCMHAAAVQVLYVGPAL